MHRVDLHIPSEAIVGGYSITSAPHHLRERGTIDLAIQYSDHPPTLWMSTKVCSDDIAYLLQVTASEVCSGQYRSLVYLSCMWKSSMKREREHLYKCPARAYLFGRRGRSGEALEI